MIFDVITWVTVCGGVFSILFMIFWMLYQPPRHTIDELPEFLQRLDLGKLRELLDPAREWELRQNLTKCEFRRIQRRRFWLYIQYLHKMAHNALILVELANEELGDRDMEKCPRLGAIHREAVAVRAYALFMIVKVHVLLFFRMQTRSWLFEFRKVSGLDGIESYERLKTAATHFFLTIDRCDIDQLLDSM